MGTSVKMIENHYGHVNTIKHADRVLMGIGGWEAMHVEMDAEDAAEEATAKVRQAARCLTCRPRPSSCAVRAIPKASCFLESFQISA